MEKDAATAHLTYGGRQGRGDHGRRHHIPAWSGTHGPGSATIWSKGRGHYPDIRLPGRRRMGCLVQRHAALISSRPLPAKRSERRGALTMAEPQSFPYETRLNIY